MTDMDTDSVREFHAFQRKRLRRHRRGFGRIAATCPTCKRPGVLSAWEIVQGYQCRDCTRRDEGTEV